MKEIINKLAALAERVRLLERRLAQLSPNSAHSVVLDKEHDRVIERIRLLKSQYSEHQNWSKEDKEELQRLATRRKELRNMLGIKY